MVEEEVVKSLQVCRGIFMVQEGNEANSIFPPYTTARSCSMLFIILDVLKPLGDKAVIESELEGFGIRLVSNLTNHAGHARICTEL